MRSRRLHTLWQCQWRQTQRAAFGIPCICNQGALLAVGVSWRAHSTDLVLLCSMCMCVALLALLCVCGLLGQCMMPFQDG